MCHFEPLPRAAGRTIGKVSLPAGKKLGRVNPRLHCQDPTHPGLPWAGGTCLKSSLAGFIQGPLRIEGVWGEKWPQELGTPLRGFYVGLLGA